MVLRAIITSFFAVVLKKSVSRIIVFRLYLFIRVDELLQAIEIHSKIYQQQHSNYKKQR